MFVEYKMLCWHRMEWHTGELHVRAQQPKPAKQSQLHPVTMETRGSSDTCDDDLGDIQNGAVWCRFTMASFKLRTCCGKHTYTHTAANTTSMRTDTDSGPQLDRTCGPLSCRAYIVRARAACSPSLPGAVECYCLHHITFWAQSAAGIKLCCWLGSKFHTSI